MNKPLFVANWKMHKTCAEAEQFVVQLLKLVDASNSAPDIGIAPSFLGIAATKLALQNNPGVLVGAQNVHWLEHGAHTGEVSVEMLLEVGAQFAICGHSERRQFYGETNQTVMLRANAAMRRGLTAIVCVGESEDEFRREISRKVVAEQLAGSLAGIQPEQLPLLVVAYEPVWAIGTGLAATPQIAQAMHSYIREILTTQFGKNAASSIPLLYGGSTKPENIGELMAQPDIDGALVGGASLIPETFSMLIKNGREAWLAASSCRFGTTSGQ